MGEPTTHTGIVRRPKWEHKHEDGATKEEKQPRHQHQHQQKQQFGWSMRNRLLLVIFVTLANIIWCEYGHYYYNYLLYCRWPTILSNTTNLRNEPTKVMVITDVHIMGKRKSLWLDKHRREWLMQQSFAISNRLLAPDIVVFLGDLIDEGSYSKDEDYDQYVDQFKRIFPVDPGKQESVFIPGNHDIGFHDTMKNFPYLLYRFINRFNSTYSIMLLASKKRPSIKFILLNSMTFGNDSCELCTQSLIEANYLSKKFDEDKNKGTPAYSRPILLTHFPLYRHNDTNCDYPKAMLHTVSKPNQPAKDVIPEEKSQSILRKFDPRLVLSGHTHMNCKIEHEVILDAQPGRRRSRRRIPEITLTSYNHKYAENRPHFLLLTATNSQQAIRLCEIPSEIVVCALYILNSIFALVIMSIKKEKRTE